MILFWTPQQQILIDFWIREDESPTNARKEDHHKRNDVRSVGILIVGHKNPPHIFAGESDELASLGRL